MGCLFDSDTGIGIAVDAVGMRGSDSLDDHGTGSASTIAHSSNTNLCIVNVEHTCQSRHYPRAGTKTINTYSYRGGGPSERVSKCDCTAKDIDFICTQAQNLAICKRNDTECFVDFIVVYLFFSHSSMFQCLRDSQRRRRGKRNGFLHVNFPHPFPIGEYLLRLTPSKDLGDRFQSQFLDFTSRDKNQRSSPIRQRRRIRRSHRPVRLKRRSNSSQLGFIQLSHQRLSKRIGMGGHVFRIFIIFDDDGGFALCAGDFNGFDFVEMACCSGSLSTFIT